MGRELSSYPVAASGAGYYVIAVNEANECSRIAVNDFIEAMGGGRPIRAVKTLWRLGANPPAIPKANLRVQLQQGGGTTLAFVGSTYAETNGWLTAQPTREAAGAQPIQFARVYISAEDDDDSDPQIALSDIVEFDRFDDIGVTIAQFNSALAIRDSEIATVALQVAANSKSIAAVGAANLPPPLGELAAKMDYAEGEGASWKQLPEGQQSFPRKTDLLVAAMFYTTDPRTAGANVTLPNLYGAQAAGAPNAADIAAIANSKIRFFANAHSPSNPLQGVNAMAYGTPLIVPATAGRLNAAQEADNGNIFGAFSFSILANLPTSGDQLIPVLHTDANNNPARARVIIGYRNGKLIVEQAGGNAVQQQRTDTYVAADIANALHNQQYQAVLPAAFTGGQVTIEFIKESTNNAALREVVTRTFNIPNAAANVAAANVVYNFENEAIETARVSYTASTRRLRIDTANSFPAVINQQYHLRVKYPVTVNWEQPGSWSDYELLSADDHDQYGDFDAGLDPDRHRLQRIDAAFCFQNKFPGNEADPYMTLRVRLNGYSNHRIIDLNRKRSELFPNGFNLRAGGTQFAAAQLAAQRWEERPPTDAQLSQIAAAHAWGKPGLGVYHKASGKDAFGLDGQFSSKTAAGDTAKPVHFGEQNLLAAQIANAQLSISAPSPINLTGAKAVIVAVSTGTGFELEFAEIPIAQIYQDPRQHSAGAASGRRAIFSFPNNTATAAATIRADELLGGYRIVAVYKKTQ